MANETQTAPVIKKKKKWYAVVAPKEMNNVLIGETLSQEPGALVGRGFNVNLMTLTNDMKKQNMMARFKVTAVKESTAETEFVAFHLSTAHIRRLAKRARDKVEDSFKCKTKDGKAITVKPLLLVRSKLQRTALTSLRMAAREAITKEAEKSTFMDLSLAVINGDLQRQLKQPLKKVYPVMMAEIRAVELA